MSFGLPPSTTPNNAQYIPGFSEPNLFPTSMSLFHRATEFPMHSPQGLRPICISGMLHVPIPSVDVVNPFPSTTYLSRSYPNSLSIPESSSYPTPSHLLQYSQPSNASFTVRSAFTKHSTEGNVAKATSVTNCSVEDHSRLNANADKRVSCVKLTDVMEQSSNDTKKIPVREGKHQPLSMKQIRELRRLCRKTANRAEFEGRLIQIRQIASIAAMASSCVHMFDPSNLNSGASLHAWVDHHRATGADWRDERPLNSPALRQLREWDLKLKEWTHSTTRDHMKEHPSHSISPDEPTKQCPAGSSALSASHHVTKCLTHGIHKNLNTSPNFYCPNRSSARSPHVHVVSDRQVPIPMLRRIGSHVDGQPLQNELDSQKQNQEQPLQNELYSRNQNQEQPLSRFELDCLRPSTGRTVRYPQPLASTNSTDRGPETHVYTNQAEHASHSVPSAHSNKRASYALQLVPSTLEEYPRRSKSIQPAASNHSQIDVDLASSQSLRYKSQICNVIPSHPSQSSDKQKTSFPLAVSVKGDKTTSSTDTNYENGFVVAGAPDLISSLGQPSGCFTSPFASNSENKKFRPSTVSHPANRDYRVWSRAGISPNVTPTQASESKHGLNFPITCNASTLRRNSRPPLQKVSMNTLEQALRSVKPSSQANKNAYELLHTLGLAKNGESGDENRKPIDVTERSVAPRTSEEKSWRPGFPSGRGTVLEHDKPSNSLHQSSRDFSKTFGKNTSIRAGGSMRSAPLKVKTQHGGHVSRDWASLNRLPTSHL